MCIQYFCFASVQKIKNRLETFGWFVIEDDVKSCLINSRDFCCQVSSYWEIFSVVVSSAWEPHATDCVVIVLYDYCFPTYYRFFAQAFKDTLCSTIRRRYTWPWVQFCCTRRCRPPKNSVAIIQMVSRTTWVLLLLWCWY